VPPVAGSCSRNASSSGLKPWLWLMSLADIVTMFERTYVCLPNSTRSSGFITLCASD